METHGVRTNLKAKHPQQDMNSLSNPPCYRLSCHCLRYGCAWFFIHDLRTQLAWEWRCISLPNYPIRFIQWSLSTKAFSTIWLVLCISTFPLALSHVCAHVCMYVVHFIASCCLSVCTCIPSLHLIYSKDCVAHKTFHRYTVRAKRGTVQSARDGKHGGHQPRSAGASLRRYNEAALEEVRWCMLWWYDAWLVLYYYSSTASYSAVAMQLLCCCYAVCYDAVDVEI